MNGVAMTTSSEVEKFAHTSSGMRQKLMPGRAHGDDRHEEVQRGRDRRRARELHADREEHLPHRHLGRQRRVGRPAGGERAAGREERRGHHQPAERQHPERQRVQARERHVRRADHQRQDEVRQPREDRDDEQEDHQRRVDAEEPVVRVGVDELRPGAASSARISIASRPPTSMKKNEVHDVLDADHLVVGVDAEVVLPASRAVRGVVLGPRRPARCPVEPVVEGAEADEEEQRRGDQRDGQDGVLELASQPSAPSNGFEKP